MRCQQGRVSGCDRELAHAPSVKKDIQSYSRLLPNLDFTGRQIKVPLGMDSSGKTKNKLPPLCKRVLSLTENGLTCLWAVSTFCFHQKEKILRRTSGGSLHARRLICAGRRPATPPGGRRASQRPLFHSSSILPLMEAAFLPSTHIHPLPPNVLHPVRNHLVLPRLFISAGRADGLSCSHWFTNGSFSPSPRPLASPSPLPSPLRHIKSQRLVVDLVLGFI